MITKIEKKEIKETVCLDILEALPEWFEIPESRVSYSKACREMPFWADTEADTVRGFIAMKETSQYAAEIYVMGIKKEYHRQGIGKALFHAFYAYAKNHGYEFIHVKTVRQGIYADYDQTNAFYRAVGFRELECMEDLWDAANPCQVYVMAVR